jgi:hypothetical protein
LASEELPKNPNEKPVSSSDEVTPLSSSDVSSPSDAVPENPNVKPPSSEETSSSSSEAI